LQVGTEMEVKRVFIVLETNENFSLRGPAGMVAERAGGFTPLVRGSTELAEVRPVGSSRLG